eukprot:4599506-Amphidinium_carterae.1
MKLLLGAKLPIWIAVIRLQILRSSFPPSSGLPKSSPRTEWATSIALKRASIAASLDDLASCGWKRTGIAQHRPDPNASQSPRRGDSHEALSFDGSQKSELSRTQPWQRSESGTVA